LPASINITLPLGDWIKIESACPTSRKWILRLLDAAWSGAKYEENKAKNRRHDKRFLLFYLSID